MEQQKIAQSNVQEQQCHDIEIFDTHCHLSVFKQIDELINNICVKLLICSISSSEFEQIASLQEQINNKIQVIGRGFGIHPHFAYTYNENILAEVQHYIESIKKSFIGEIGLEQRQQYLQENPMDIQINCFQQLLELCFKYNKPGSIHLVARKCDGYQNAHQVFLQILNEIKQRYTSKPILILHSYSGSYETLKQIIQLYENILIGVGHLNYNTKHIQRIMQDEKFKYKIIFETDFYDPITQNYTQLLKIQQQVQVYNSNLIQLFTNN